MLQNRANRRRSWTSRASQRVCLGRAGAVCLTLAALGVGGCGTADREEAAAGGGQSEWTAPAEVTEALKNEGTIEVIDHNQTSSSLEAQLYAAALREFGADVKIVPMADFAATWEAVANNDNLVDMEVWFAQYPEQSKKYVEQEKTVLAPKSDIEGVEGWYVPTYVIEGDAERGIEPTCPDLPDWKALNDCADVFATAATRPKGRYVSGAKAWGEYYGDPQRIKNLGLNYELTFAGSEAALQAEWVRALEQGKPQLALMWEPHYVMGKYDLTRVEFPEPTGDCWGTTFACNWLPQDIRHMISSKFPEKHPTAMQVLENYDLNNEQIGEMLVVMEEQGKKASEVVEQWMKENPAVWQAWASDGAQ